MFNRILKTIQKMVFIYFIIILTVMFLQKIVLADVTVTDGNNVFCSIVAGVEDLVAARSLQAYFNEKFGVQVDIIDPCSASSGTQTCQILLGTEVTNPYLSQIANLHSIDINSTDLTEDGYILQTVNAVDRDYVIAAGGGKRGVFYSVGELKNYHIRKIYDLVVILPARVREIPVFKYRLLWTWDLRMEWGDTGLGSDVMGGGVYHKDPNAYLIDYKACIDYMCENGLNGLMIWGFLRDDHGGIDDAKELCNYASERGVRILPGVGTSGYNGYYYQGNHPYNMRTWLSEHPELTGDITYFDIPVTSAACPSKQANRDWRVKGGEWMINNFAVGGVDLENGDLFICHCNYCVAARAAMGGSDASYYKDQAICHGPCIEALLRLKPGFWWIHTTYTGFTKEMMINPPVFINHMPKETIYMWSLTDMMNPGNWPSGLKPVPMHNIGHLSCANKSHHTENDLFIEGLQSAASKSYDANMEGLSILGEMPDSRVNMQLNYLAFKEFCFHPTMTIQEFTTKRLAPLYGPDLTDELWNIINLVRTSDLRSSGERVGDALDIAINAYYQSPDYAKENWQKILTYLQKESYQPNVYECDLDKNGYVDWGDLEILAGKWLATGCVAYGWCDGADLNRSREVDFADFNILANKWMSKMPDPCIIGWWKLEEMNGTSATDSSGNNNTGSLMNGLRFNNDSVPGVICRALHLDGVKDKIYAPGISLSEGSLFSITFWFNPDTILSSSTGRQDFVYWDGGGGHPSLTIVSGGAISFRLSMKDQATRIVSTTTHTWCAGSWYHIAATYDGVNARIYVNGILENELYCPGRIKATKGFYFGGGSQGFWTVNLHGKIDDVRIYDGPLDDSNVADMYNLFKVPDFNGDGKVDFYDLAILSDQWLLERLSADVAPGRGDGIVNFLDWTVFADGWHGDMNNLADFASQWLKSGAYSADIAPLPPDGIVNFLDYAVFTEHWLEKD